MNDISASPNISPSYYLDSSRVSFVNSLTPLHFREEVAFAVERLPFYKPIVDKYGHKLRNTDYEHILYLQGDNRVITFLTTDDGIVTIPLTPASRYFDYFLPFLKDKWMNNSDTLTVNVQFTKRELLCIKHITGNCHYYKDIKNVYDYFLAKPIAYYNIIYPSEFMNINLFDELGKITKDVIDLVYLNKLMRFTNTDRIDIEEEINNLFPSFNEIPDALYYFAYNMRSSSMLLKESTYIIARYYLASNYCNLYGHHKNALFLLMRTQTNNKATTKNDRFYELLFILLCLLTVVICAFITKITIMIYNR